MNDCFFCGPTDNPLTEEHVWPKWVSRLLHGQFNSDHFVHLRSTGDNTTGNWNSRYLDITTDTVCDKCNNIWLSDFENKEIKPLATPLIIGTDDAIIPPAAQWKLAAWAYKMAMLIEVANPDNPPDFFTPSERLQFRQTTLPHECVRVFLAKYDYGQHPAHSATPLHTYTQREGERKTFKLKISTMTAGALAMQLMSVRLATSDDLVYASEMEFEFLGKAVDAVLPIWPPRSEAVRWPPKQPMTTQDIEDWTNMWKAPVK
jgi:hypothetical protein